jgi:predicted transposase/invertase (TIGR01784 family)
MKNPHDKYFKKTFEDIEVAKDYLINYVPKNITKLVDINSLSHEKESFIDKELEGLYTDVLFKTDINGKEGYIYFLIEHKSYVTKMVGIQLMIYIAKIWERKMKKGKLPLVIPLVVYHGEKKWNIKNDLISLIDGIETLPTEIKNYIPNFQYIINDLSALSDEQIKGNVILQIFIKVVQSIYKGEEEFLKTVEEVSIALEHLEQKDKAIEYFIVFLKYVVNAKQDISKGKVFKTIEKVSPERSDVILTIAEQLINEGIEKGIEKGLKKGIGKGQLKEKKETAIRLKKSGADIDFISKATELSIDDLKEFVFND